jgi:hypothetical protein
VWIHDFKNSHEIISCRDRKPRVEVIGPFVVNLRRQKDVISFVQQTLR